MTQSLALSPGNDLALAQKMARDCGLTNFNNNQLTGWWKILSERLQSAIETEGIIFGTAGGFVKEAAKVKMELGRISYQNRVAILIEPITGNELDYYKNFYFAEVRQSARYFDQVPRYA